MMVFIDDSPVVNDEQDTATNTKSQDNLVSTNGKENGITLHRFVHQISSFLLIDDFFYTYYVEPRIHLKDPEIQH